MRTVFITISNNLIYDQRMQKTALSLQKAGYMVKIIGRNFEKNSSDNSSAINLSQNEYHHLLIQCFFNKKALFYLEFNLRLIIYLLFQKFDILCAVDTDTLAACAIISQIKRKPLIFDSHELFAEVPELENRQLVKKCWQSIEKIFIPKAKICYTVSTSLSNILSNKYRKNFEVIRNLPYLNKRTINLTTKGEYLIYQGAVNKGRGLEELILAMQSIDFPLVIAGNGDILVKVKRMAEELELTNKINFTGYLLPEKLKNLTQNAFAGYNLLDEKSKSYYFSLSNKYFDYMQQAIPSLSNPFPEYKKIEEQFQVGILLNTNSQEIINAVGLLHKNESFYLQLRENCVKARNNFCWEIEEKKLLELYEQC